MSEKLSLMMYFTLYDFLITVLVNQIIGQNTNLFSITLRFFGLTVLAPLRVKQRKSIINHTAFHFTGVYSTQR